MFTIDDMRLNAALKLPPLHRSVCHGYANCCGCGECLERAGHGERAPVPARQPWEPKNFISLTDDRVVPASVPSGQEARRVA